MRNKRLRLNVVSSLTNELIAVLVSLIVPRLIIGNYGSAVNGLIISINNFLAFFSLCEAGIGPVIRANLYGPLAMRDDIGISKVMKSAENFFRIIAVIFVGYTFLLAVVYPRLNANSEEFDLPYVVSLLFILSVTTFIQYYFGITHQILLTAGQQSYVHLFSNAATMFGNIIFTALLIQMDASIHVVKFCSAGIFALKPVIYAVYIQKHYKIDKTVVLDEEPIKQKWNGMALHFCGVIQDHTDAVLLTVFSSLSQISVYTVYLSVVNGIKGLIYTANHSMAALFGEMIAKGEKRP